jgi:hypothetical protein
MATFRKVSQGKPLIPAAMPVLLGSPTLLPANKGFLARFGFVLAAFSCCKPPLRAANDFKALPMGATGSTQHGRNTEHHVLFTPNLFSD